jgi:hypothetical protein
MPLAVGRHHANQPGGDDRTAQEYDPIEDGTDHRRGDKKIATDVLKQRVHMALALIGVPGAFSGKRTVRG